MAAFAAFACLLIGFGLAEWHASQQSPPHNHERATVTSKENRQNSGTVSNPQRQNEQKSTSEKAQRYGTFTKHPTEWLLALFNLFLVAFTGLLWWSTNKLWKASQEQLEHARSEAGHARFNRIREEARLNEQISIAQQTADAATLNAKAAIDAERAHLYVIIKNETIKSTFQSARMYDNSPSMHPTKMNGPGIQYVLRNYGKTPAILHHVWHGISVQTNPSEMKTLVAGAGALEVIGIGADTPEETVVYTEPFTFGDARALVTEDKVLYFFGEAEYSDAFGGHIKLEWEFIADGGKLRQIKHKETRQTQPEPA